MQKSLFDITEEELKELTNLAALFFTPREIAVMLEFEQDVFEFVCRSEGPNDSINDFRIYQAFHKGRLQAEVDLRTSIIKLAKSGSSPAQTMALDLLNKSKLKMLDR